MKNLLSFLLIFSILAFSNCKSAQKSKETSAPISNTGGSKGRLVKATELEAFLPSEVLTLERTAINSEKTEISDKDVVSASAAYKGTEKMIHITITDAASSATGVSGLAPWMKGDLNNKWDQGYERTADFDGYKGYESYDRQDQSGQASVLVNNRFIISVNGEKVAEGETREALKAVDLKKLAGLR